MKNTVACPCDRPVGNWSIPTSVAEAVRPRSGTGGDYRDGNFLAAYFNDYISIRAKYKCEVRGVLDASASLVYKGVSSVFF